MSETATRKAHRLAELVISQVAGVDFPAHLQDGWAVMKAAGGEATEVDALIAGMGDEEREVALGLVDELIASIEASAGGEPALPVSEPEVQPMTTTPAMSPTEAAAKALDVLAGMQADATGEPLHKAYQAVLATEAGAVLYAQLEGYEDAPLAGERGLLTKAVPAGWGRQQVRDLRGAAEHELEELAKDRAFKTGESFAKAYSQVLDTDKGRQLFATSEWAATRLGRDAE